MSETPTGNPEAAASGAQLERPDAEVLANGEAAAAAVRELETEHALAEDPERRCADIKVWVEAECDYFGIEPKNDPVADQITEILFAHETSMLERGRDDYDVTAEDTRRLDRVIQRGMESAGALEETAVLADETAALADEAAVEEQAVAGAQAETEAVEASALTDEAAAGLHEAEAATETERAEEYHALIEELKAQGLSNEQLVARLSSHEAVPESERARWQAFGRILTVAQAVPADAAIITQRFNQLDMSRGAPDPVQFIQTAIFSSPDFDTGVSQATQDAIAAEFNLTPTRPAQPRNATEMQTTLREGRGTREITEIRRVERPPDSGNWVEEEVVVGEVVLPFTEQDRLVLSESPRVTIHPLGVGETHRVEGLVEGAGPIGFEVDIPPSGALPVADIHRQMNKQLLDTTFSNAGLNGAMEYLTTGQDGALGTSADTSNGAIGEADVLQNMLHAFSGHTVDVSGRFLTEDELNEIRPSLLWFAPDGDLGMANRNDPARTIHMMQALFGGSQGEITANLRRANSVIDAGLPVAPSYQALYEHMYPDDAASGYPRLREIIGNDGMAMLNLG